MNENQQPQGTASPPTPPAPPVPTPTSPAPPVQTPTPTPPAPPAPADPSTGEKLYRWGKNNEVILYLFFGVLTTGVNFLSFFFLRQFSEMEMTLAVIVSWFVSVLFAYITNKIWVFKRRSKNPKKIVEEASLFFALRGFSGLLDVGLMWLFVDQLNLPQYWMKLAVNVLVVLINYITSKVWIFANPSDKKLGHGKKSKENNKAQNNKK